jgi:DNA-binding NarL/FixJ family response regulator
VHNHLMIVEDDPAMLDVWLDLLEDAFEVVACASTLEQARALYAQHRPRLALVDLGLPDGDGCDFIREAVSKDPNFVALVATVFGDEPHVVRAVQAGARGYILKDATLASIHRALEDAQSGGVPLSPQVARYLLKAIQLPSPASKVSSGAPALSARERDVLELIAKGCSAAEAARALGVAQSTVLAHTKSLYKKLEVHSRAEAVFEARQFGLLA